MSLKERPSDIQSQIKIDPVTSLVKRATADTLASSLPRNLLRTAKWSSDGSTILTEAEDRTIRLFHSPCVPAEGDECAEDKCSWNPVRQFPMADALLSTCWFPYSSLHDPSRYCFVAAVKDHPIQLLDASDGRIRASYPIVDHTERVVAPHSMLFSSDGSTLYAGFDSAIEKFDVSRAGQDGERYKTLSSRKSKDGQKGIISALALDPSRQGLLGAATFSGQIALHDIQSNELRPEIVFHSGEPGGITQIKFHPYNNQVLFSASRKSNKILCWDLRYASTTFHSFYRPGRTNQKISFDIDCPGVNLVTGGTDGKVRLYRLDDLSESGHVFQVHIDTVGSAAFSPTSWSIVTCAGSRRIPSISSSTPSCCSTSDERAFELKGSSSDRPNEYHRSTTELSLSQIPLICDNMAEWLRRLTRIASLSSSIGISRAGLLTVPRDQRECGWPRRRRATCFLPPEHYHWTDTSDVHCLSVTQSLISVGHAILFSVNMCLNDRMARTTRILGKGKLS
ncbi:hypothetical protein O181_022952 [Austropuccinia psidii MF-1]|uniref:Uncharacterized protein n=1 Tax=Austropuccinia psidii MF-1 TaxID=1389203 RepID=A0A9Q3GXL9_9BASI|nr:hypothetical protein [Austropuccinia psidii MF-1]